MEKDINSPKRVLKIPLETLNACVQCGLCKTVCPTYREELDEAYSPRGRILLAKTLLEGKLQLSPEVAKRWDECTLCRNCEDICPNGVDYKELLVHVREEVNKNLGKDWVKYLGLKSLTFQGNSIQKLALKAGAFISKLFLGKGDTMPVVFPTGAVKYFPKPKFNAQSLRGKIFLPKGKAKATFIFFPGCMYENFYTQTAENVVHILQKLGYKVIVPDGVSCCGGPHYYSGFTDMFNRLREKNTEIFTKLAKKYSVDGLVVVCPTGGGTFKEDYDLPFPVYELVEILDKELKELKVEKEEKVTIHYPCHSYTAMKIPTDVFDRVASKGAKVVKGELNKSCCGFAGMFSVKNPGLSQKILKRKMEDFSQCGAQTILTSCPGCVLQLNEGSIRYANDLKVEHIADFVAKRFLTEEEKQTYQQLWEEYRV
ncbi:MAG TPA: (Fe-S)-binding protein [Aquifex aeolicus]|uniref:Glycolate oxidase iron-sulfur subunit n=1 Tax=Aquifex aeolicus TaxID=63363 RepID=A0A9D1CEG3_AQUAO|nr:(Fe-S)-binding protein [Aquificales bacterium]HIP97840.1 (Fe-S)-binding protein [Aquifex aeolicus]HIQ26311.1 (Fe-S)-binding protein [Aquifex aeolicus]